MTPGELLPWLAPGGTAALIAVIGYVFLALHRSAVDAHQRRADDWRRAYELERQAHAETRQQIATVLHSVRAGTG